MNLPNKSRRKELFQNKDYLRTYTQLIEILRKGETNISNNFKIEDSIFEHCAITPFEYSFIIYLIPLIVRSKLIFNCPILHLFNCELLYHL